jgi:hypothetical protein
MTRMQGTRLGTAHDKASSLVEYVRHKVRPLYPPDHVAADLLLQSAEDIERIAKVMRQEADGYIDPATGRQVEADP